MGDVIKGNFGGGREKAGESKPADNSVSDADLLQETLASLAIELPETGRLKKMLEAARYISSLKGTNFSILRAGPSYKDNVIVFQTMYSEGAKNELYGILEESSEEKWKKNPGYYLALIEVLRRKDILR